MFLMGLTKNIGTKDVLRYLFMPQVLPRIGQFYAAGFMQLAYFVALVYRGVNILPPNHPVLRPENRGSLNLRSVLGAAASELQFNKKNIDKIIIYLAVLLGLVLLAMQFFVLLAYVMLHPAMAQTMPTTYAGFFATPIYPGDFSNPVYDVAYGILYMVFGVPELFNPSGPVRPFHTALYGLFQLYSIGLLVIGVIVVCYLIFAILIETAQTGVPFGKRYNHVWAPIRLVFAFGLLIPIGYGLNSAQWITLYAAKFGSDFASRGWVIFNETMTESYLNNPNQRVGRPQAPQLTNLAAFMMTAAACKYANDTLYAAPGDGVVNKVIDAYLAVPATTAGGIPNRLSGRTFDQAKKDFNNGDILIRFGEQDNVLHTEYLAYTDPICGDLVIFAGDATEPGALTMQRFYYNLVRDMWTGDAYDLTTNGRNFIQKFATDEKLRNNNAALPATDYKASVAERLTRDVETALDQAVQDQSTSETWEKDQVEIARRGWGGAGIWYNKIAQINGSLVTAVNNVPGVKSMPKAMEFIRNEQLQQNTQVTNPFKTTLADGKEVQFPTKIEKIVGEGLSNISEYWTHEDTRQDGIGNQTKMTNNIFIDVINLIFGTRGLFDMCKSADVHPLAQLSILGKGLMEASIRNLAIAGLGAGVAATQIPFLGIASKVASKILLSVASMTLSLGFILFYVLPFMPFLYFFFAVGGWIKGLFEAMVGVPLWALAHLRIDGEGLPGDAAISGYFLIFEIFLRPILIVFGLLASVVIFAAMVKVLNEIFYLVVTNLSGHDENTKTLCGQISGGGSTGGGGGGGDAVQFFRGPVDELFFTIIYAIIVYMIGMSCFKLIDLVPNNILRYMNVSVLTFNDNQHDQAGSMMGTLAVGSRAVSGQMINIGESGLDAAGKIGRGVIDAAAGPPKTPQG